MEIHSDLDERRFIQLNEDIDAVLYGDKRDIRLLVVMGKVGFARLSMSGLVLNIFIGLVYYTKIDTEGAGAVLECGPGDC